MMLRLVRLCLLVCGTCYRQVTPVVRKSSSHVIHLIMSSPSGSQWKLNSFQWINGHSCLHLRNTSISSWPSCNRVFPMSSNRLLSESLQDCTVPFPGITWLSVGVICDSTSAGTTCNSILHIIIYESLELDLNWFQICMWMNDTLGTCMSANIIEMLQPLPSQWPCRATLSQCHVVAEGPGVWPHLKKLATLRCRNHDITRLQCRGPYVLSLLRFPGCFFLGV